MSLAALPVSVSDLTTLQQGIQFFTDTSEATMEAAAINTVGFPHTVLSYAASLLDNNISLSQVAMGVSAFEEGGTIAVGNSTTPNTLMFLSTQFLPNQVAYANAHGFNPTVYAAQSLGLALADTPGFATVAPLGTSALAAETGVNVNAINGWLSYWTGFYSANPGALHGLTVAAAAFGATLGDTVGAAINSNTGHAPILHTEVIGDTLAGFVANGLVDIAEGAYKLGLPLVGLPAHALLQGESSPP